MSSSIDQRKFKRMTRRELVKLTPIVAIGAFAIPALQKPLLHAGLGLSDWAARTLFRRGHLAPTFSESELTPFNKFPINDYDVDDPGVDLDAWTLTVIGRFGGARLSDFLNMIGADTTAKFVYLECADDYYSSIEMATALHPQTLLCYEMYDQPLTAGHGAPLRLQIPTRIGYQQAKWLTDLKVTNVLQRVGYWEDQGYSSNYTL
jgi:DMSO/TMAO reductase YedYZ molybdopterin-dependent catalytic subunit